MPVSELPSANRHILKRAGTLSDLRVPKGRSDYEPDPPARATTWGSVSSGFREIELRGDRLESVGHLAPFLAPAKALGIPGYTDGMAKVMVSLPDDLLAEVDAEAQRGGTTRSAVMRGFADAALRQRRESRAAAMRSLLGDASPHGGRAADLVKATRPGS